MDEVTRHTALAGLSEMEIVEVVGREMARRQKAGIMYFFDALNPRDCEVAHCVLAWAGADDVTEMEIPRQLMIFGAVAKIQGDSATQMTTMRVNVPKVEEA